MTAFELHLEIDQKLQEQGSYRKDRIFAEAKDLALNQAQDQIFEQIVDDIIGKKQIRLKHIQPLMEKAKELIPIQNYSGALQRSAPCAIPPYIHFISNVQGEVATNRLCNDLVSPTVSYSLYSATLTFPEGGSSPYYNNFQIVNAAATVIYSAPAAFTGRFTSTDQKYEIIQDIIDTLNVPSGSRWVVVDNNRITIYSTVNDVSYTMSHAGGTTGAVAVTNLAYTKPDVATYTANTEITLSPVSFRHIEPDHTLVQKLYLNRFTGPKKNEPFYSISKDFLWVYYAEDSIVTNVYIDYIRKPKKISLLLNRTSELDPSVHEQIVDRAVEILKKNIQDPSLPGDVQHNEITTRK
jgi:hypothetical protein